MRVPPRGRLRAVSSAANGAGDIRAALGKLNERYATVKTIVETMPGSYDYGTIRSICIALATRGELLASRGGSMTAMRGPWRFKNV